MNTSLLGRAASYADLAFKLRRWSKATDDVVQDNARAHVAMRMGRLRGLPQKVGQILSMADDERKAESFGALADQAEPLDFEEVAPILREAWNREISTIVMSIASEGRAASLGQVHRAVLRDGRTAAVKVQYPGIRKAVMNDLRLLGWLSAPVGDLRRGFDLSGYRAEILRDLEDELDYRIEAGYQKQFDRLSVEVPGWVVPRVFDELCTEQVLVTEWIEGERIESAATWPASVRQDLAMSLLRGFLWQLSRFGRLHADPNPGNYRFIRSDVHSQVLLYDYGSVVELAPRQSAALLKLIEITQRREGDPYPLFVAMGFREALLQPLRPKLAALCATLLEPFTCPGRFDTARWNRTTRVQDILAEDRWNFRMSGPPWFIFVMRAFRGLLYYLEKLNCPVPWSIAVEPYFTHRRTELDALHADAEPIEVGTFNGMARHLRIRVTRQGETKVSLTFPCAAVDDLGELMDDELQQRIAGRGVRVEALVKRAREYAYMPHDILNWDDEATGRQIRVWLE